MGKPAPSLTPVSLLDRLGRDPNDPGAWSEFVQHYGVKVLLWCRYWGLQHADADDVTQEVLVEVARKMQTFTYDPARSFRAWLKTLTHAAWCAWLERRSRQAQGSGAGGALGAVRALSAALARADERSHPGALAQATCPTARERAHARRLGIPGRPGAPVARPHRRGSRSGSGSGVGGGSGCRRAVRRAVRSPGRNG